MSDISLLLLSGWKNIWKEKIIWLFSALVLIEPLVRLIRIQKDSGSFVSLLNFVVILVFIPLPFVSYTGVTYIIYCVISDNPISVQIAFQAVRKFFWRVVGSTFLMSLFFIPCLCTAFLFSSKQTPQISDVGHNFYFASIPFSIFGAVLYFLWTEIIITDSGIRKGLKTAWVVFTNHFAILAGIGAILAGLSYVTSIAIGMTTILIQYNFDLAALSKLDYISPYLSFTDNNFYKLVNAAVQALWSTFTTSVFVIAYLKYSGVKTNAHLVP